MAHDAPRRQRSSAWLTPEHLDRRLTLAATAILAAALLVGLPTRASEALFGDQAVVDGNTFTTGIWTTPLVTYLHNNPTPPVGNTNAQANLPMSANVPTAVTLFNYDANRDAAAGLRIQRGGVGAGEAVLARYQNWRSAVLGSPRLISGAVVVSFWSGMANFAQAQTGSVQVFLRDFNPANGTYVEISNATLTLPNWQGGSPTWVNRTLAINVAGYTISAGRRLEVKFIVPAAAANNMWFAYDTVTYQTSVTLP